MSIIGSWLWGTSQLDDAVDKATSELLPSGAEDIALNLEICDQIRSKSVSAKDAMKALKRRLNHSNPNVQVLALSLTDTCVKNGGDLFLNEIASREFMDNFVSILKIRHLNHDVKNTILRLIQNWSVAFEGKQNLSYVGQVYKNLLKEDYKFPPKDLSVANSAMVDTQTAPEWIDSDVCLRCRTAFTFTNRKHHCRNCGQVFDQQCSSKAMPLPHFGITQEVRVCDGCYSKLTKKALKSDRAHKHSHSHASRSRSAQGLADEELQRAIQLSLQEAGASGSHGRPGYVPAQPTPSQWQYSEPPIVERPSYSNEEEDDPDLKAAIEASLREANAPKPSAPIAPPTPKAEERSYSYDHDSFIPTPPPAQPPLPKLPRYELDTSESDVILTFNQTVEQLQAQGGRDISRYPGMNELYDKANGLRPKLALSLDDAGRKEQMLADMHEKLSQTVKLYDQLLTEQVIHPRWRPAQPANAYHARAPSVNGVPSNLQPQWTGNAQGTLTGYVPTDAPQSTWYPPQQQAQYAQPDGQYSPNVPISSPQAVSSPPQLQQYSEVSQIHYSGPTPTPNQAVRPFSIQSQVIPSMANAVKSPPPGAIHQDFNTPFTEPQHPSLSLARSNSVSSSYATSPPSASGHLTRSNTVSFPPGRTYQQAMPNAQTPQQHYRHHSQQPQRMYPTPQQQQHQQQQTFIASPPAPPTSTAPTMPHFPSVPTTLPQVGQMYGPSIPTGVAQTEERKEALLIDL
ncbi:hypothetical protein AX17_006318 [Amanita inopinata Kibby_2008]|nr:hypothetical protein AX17_006318 [Amanita inopinata Kibby_2008]